MKKTTVYSSMMVAGFFLGIFGVFGIMQVWETKLPFAQTVIIMQTLFCFLVMISGIVLLFQEQSEDNIMNKGTVTR